MFEQLKSIAQSADSAFVLDVAGAAALTVILVAGLHLPALV